MKILHFADTHIGVETYGTIDPATGLSTRVLDELRALDTVIDCAVGKRVDTVLFCGDAYKNRDPSPTLQREFARRMRRLSEAKIHTVIVVGNHDLPGSPGKANSVEIFDTLDIEFIHVAGKPGIIEIPTSEGGLQVAVFPWLRRNAVLSREEMKNLGINQVRDQLQEAMSARLVELSSAIDPGRPAVLAGHVAVANASIGTERNMVIGTDPVVMLSTIANQVYDYVALGHVHTRQVLSEDPPVVYAGSLERLDFGDEDQEKGFYLVEIAVEKGAKTTKYEFCSLPARKFVTVAVEISDDDDDPTASVLSAVGARAGEIPGAIVRLNLSLPTALAGRLREPDVLKALKEAYNVTVARQLRGSARGRGSGWITATMTPLDALKRYVENTNVPAERRRILLEYGEKLINEKLSSERGT